MTKKQGMLGNATAQGLLRKREKILAAQREDDIRHVMSTMNGRRFVWRLIEEASGYTDVTLPSTGEENTFRHEGRRAVAVELVREIQRVAPDEYVQALTEVLAARRDDELAKENAETETDDDDA